MPLSAPFTFGAAMDACYDIAMSYHHLALATRDMAAIHAFYEGIMGFDLVKLRPDREVAGASTGAVRISVLSEKAKQYAIYCRGKSKGFTLRLDLPAANYRADWVDVATTLIG